MYGIVLMAAVTAGPDTASFGKRSLGCHGCSGAACYGAACYGACYGCGNSVAMPGYTPPGYSYPITARPGSGVAGCYGISGAPLSPPVGASCFGLGYTNQYSVMHGGFFGHRHGCDGWGMFGHRHNCHGCFGGCGGSFVLGCNGDPWPFVGGCSGCYGCFGVPYGCTGYGYYDIQMGAPITDVPPMTTPMTTPMTPGGGTGTGTGGSDGKVDPKGTDPKGTDPKGTDPKGTDPKGTDPKGGTGANLKFTVPADAKLYVDGRPTTGTGTERSFFTPPLVPGQRYFYDVKAEATVDGQLVTEEKRVLVEAGAVIAESFPKLTAAAAKPGAAVAANK